MTTRVLACGLALCALAAPASGQGIAIEGTHSAGVSSEELTAAGTQLRVSAKRAKRCGACASRSKARGGGARTRRANSSAPPTPTAVRSTDGSVRRIRRAAARLGACVKGGRYRTPFGIYAASDHAYIGFMRAPLIRYGEYYALSNTALEQGVDIVVGRPRLSFEASVSAPSDVGEAIRRSGVTGVVRAQAAAGAWIVGASYIDTMPSQPARWAPGRTRFGGVDVRWMASGVQVRGEWLGGQPFDGTRTDGGYADVIVHRPAMGPVTAFARAERLAYDAEPPHALYTHRYTAGARVRMWRTIAASLGVAHQAGS